MFHSLLFCNSGVQIFVTFSRLTYQFNSVKLNVIEKINYCTLKLYICFGYEEQISESDVKTISGALFLKFSIH